MRNSVVTEPSTSATPSLTPTTLTTPATRERPVLLWDRRAWRDASLTWLGQHLLLLVVAYLGRTMLVPGSSGSPTTSWGAIFHYIGGWDASLYVEIARHGYDTLAMSAFSPLLPMLEHAGLVLGIDPMWAGILISNVAFFAALGCLRVLVEREWGLAVAQRTTLYLALFPTAFFFDLGYTESLFLLCSVAAFLALRQQRWVLAGVFAALATLARNQGILLVLPIVVQIYTSQVHPRLRALQRSWPGPRSLIAMSLGILLPVIAYAGFTLYLAARFGTIFAASRAEAGFWGKDLTVPFVGFARIGNALLRLGLAPNLFQAHILIDSIFALLLIGLAVVVWRARQPLPYVVYTIATVLVLFALPGHNWLALASIGRYMLVVFPVFVVFGQWGQHRGVERWLLVASVPLLALFFLVFLAAGWIA